MNLSTSDNSVDLMLTDDELAAIAVDRESFWPADLPTVDTDDPADLLAAVRRGQRSLLVRRLLDDEGESNPDIRRLGEALAGNTNTVIVYIGGPDLLRVSPVLASVHYPLPGDWMAELITPGGVHTFTLLPRDVHVAYLQRVLEEAVSTGLPAEGVTDGEPWFVCVAVANGQQATVHAARQGEYLTATVASEGTVSDRTAGEFDAEEFARVLPV